MRFALMLLVLAMATTLTAQSRTSRPPAPAQFIIGTVHQINAQKSELTIRFTDAKTGKVEAETLTLDTSSCLLVSGFEPNVPKPAPPRRQNPLYVDSLPSRVPIDSGTPLDSKKLQIGQAVEVSVRGYRSTLLPAKQAVGHRAASLRRATHIAILPEKQRTDPRPDQAAKPTRSK